MKVKKVSHSSLERMIKAEGKFGRFMKIPSSNGNHAFIGLIMTDSVWVAWPDNLTDDEMKLYNQMYGDIPDIIPLDWDKAKRVDISEITTLADKERKEHEDDGKKPS